MKIVDQLHRELNIDTSKELKIISIVPSQTEFLYDIGLSKQIIGITKFCIHPTELFKSCAKVGGTKQLDIEKIKALNPDIIIANKEENEKSQIEELEKHFPVWISDIYTLDDAYDMMLRLGEIFQKQEQANRMLEEIRASLQTVYAKRMNLINLNSRVAYFIWREPWMIAGKNTFIDHILGEMGYENIATHLTEPNRYPEIQVDALQEIYQNAAFDIFLSTEPYPFKEKHIADLQSYFPGANIRLVDGEIFSWYGSRLRYLSNFEF